MADDGKCWANLPSVVLTEVFSYLSQEDKVRASSTCRHWRHALYQPIFWRTIHFKAKTTDQNSLSRTRYLTDCFAKKLRNAIVSFDSTNPICVQEVARVLQKICDNARLRRLMLMPSHGRFVCPGRNDEQKRFFKKHVLKPVKMLIEQCWSLEALSLGCSEQLTVHIGAFLDLLAHHQACSLRYLGLASVKDHPDHYLLLDVNPALFRSFQMLQVLSVDYDYVSDSMLAALSEVSLVRLIIHVHKIQETHPGTSNGAWTNFVHRNANCELRLTLIHSYEAVDILHSDILKPSMPLTHLRAFFCEALNSGALHRLSSWYRDSLRSVWWVDSLGLAAAYSFTEEQLDPLVRAAVRCSNLEEIILLGYKYHVDNLVGIAIMRGHSLKMLHIAAQDILYEGATMGVNEELELRVVVGEALGTMWAPLTNSQLHDVIHHPTLGDSDEVILPVVLKDQDF